MKGGSLYFITFPFSLLYFHFHIFHFTLLLSHFHFHTDIKLLLSRLWKEGSLLYYHFSIPHQLGKHLQTKYITQILSWNITLHFMVAGLKQTYRTYISRNASSSTPHPRPRVGRQSFEACEFVNQKPRMVSTYFHIQIGLTVLTVLNCLPERSRGRSNDVDWK